MPYQPTLEIAVCDYCNLNCKFCSQGTPLQRNKGFISINKIIELSKFVLPYEFEEIKISGGEPTLHPDFSDICSSIRSLFPAKRYVLATNGARLLEHEHDIGAFDIVSLSHYPGKNDAVCSSIVSKNLQNIEYAQKSDGQEIQDVFLRSNENKSNIFQSCLYSSVLKIVGDRIYKCCVIYGNSVRNGIKANNVSVLMDLNWRENLAKIDIEQYCKNCFVDVNVPKNLNIAVADLAIQAAEQVENPQLAGLKPYGSNHWNNMIDYEKICCPFCGSDSATQYRDIADIVKCNQCDIVYQRTRPTKESMVEIHQRFSDEDSCFKPPSDAADLHKTIKKWDGLLDEIIELAKPPGVFLEIGCSWGACLANARDRGYTPVGIELTRNSIAFAVTQLNIPVGG